MKNKKSGEGGKDEQTGEKNDAQLPKPDLLEEAGSEHRSALEENVKKKNEMREREREREREKREERR